MAKSVGYIVARAPAAARIFHADTQFLRGLETAPHSSASPPAPAKPSYNAHNTVEARDTRYLQLTLEVARELTFAEFGVRMYHEDGWFVLTAIRSNLVNNQLPGGMSRIVATAMRMFFNPDTHDASKSGVQVRILKPDGGHARKKVIADLPRAIPTPTCVPCFQSRVHICGCCCRAAAIPTL